MKRNTEVTLIVSAILLLFAAVMSAIATVEYWPSTARVFPGNSNDLAAWIQAFGTIGALLGAFFLGAQQAKAAHKTAMDVENERREAKQRGYRGVLEFMISETDEVVAEVKQWGTLRDLKNKWPDLDARLAAALAYFEAIPIHELGGIEAIRRAVDGRAHLNNVRDTLDRYANRGREGPDFEEAEYEEYLADTGTLDSRSRELRSHYAGGAT
ncbi:hypothetical protein [Bordetella petrii]|uniref:hypothetical protein n=1 Tax=Bordetella petrii TaxID=94624 RepID=UPI0037311305